MDRTLKALSLLLSYPSAELQAAMPQIGAIFDADKRLNKKAKQSLQPLLKMLAQGDPYALEERYVALFDRSRTLSLNLFEHVHGESRDRGTAMVSLVETYRDGGFDPASSELPDHLPVLLEFLSLRPADEARDILADAAHIFAVLDTRLGRKQSEYAAVFSTLTRLSQAKIEHAAVEELLQQPDDDPDDLEALDAVWAESQVTFGPDQNMGCNPPQSRPRDNYIPIHPVAQPNTAQ